MSTGIGETLRAAREEQDRDLSQVAQSLLVRTDYLRALEEERFDAFGGEIYAKGFLRNYAVELGLDPQPLLDTFRREVSQDEAPGPLVGAGAATTPPRRSSPPPWIAWVLVGVVVIAGLAFLGTLGSGRTPEVAGDELTTPPPSPVESEEPAAGDDDDEGDTDAAPEPEPDPEASPEPEGVEVVLALEDRSWLRVSVDGVLVEERVFEAGETLRYPGDREVLVRLGNAGGVRAQLNGEDVPSLGGRGQVVSILFTPDGVEEV